MVSHAKVIEAFLKGRKATGHHMKSVPHEEATFLIGYDWALYAMRVDDTTIVFAGWKQYSRTSSQHINMIPTTDGKDIVVYDMVEPSWAYKYYEFPDMDDWELLKHDAARVGIEYSLSDMKVKFDTGFAMVALGDNHTYFFDAENIYKIIDLLVTKDAAKIEFLRLLVSADLGKPDEHLHFDMDRLKKSVRISRSTKGLTNSLVQMILDRSHLVWRTVDGGALVFTDKKKVFLVTGTGEILKTEFERWYQIRKVFIDRKQKPEWVESSPRELLEALDDPYDAIYKLPEVVRPKILASAF